MDEKLWLAKLKQKDPEAVQLAFAEINPYLFKFLGSQNVFSPVAEDLVQSAWEIFFSKIENFEGKSKIRVYLAGIVLNKVREHRRENKKTVYEEDSEKVYAQSFTADGWWVHEPQDPQSLIESQEVQKFIQECLEGLSESQREAFLLRE
ncbi:MAG: RNA polymerase sigma factor, partial [Pseudobdellovibrio sp.]